MPIRRLPSQIWPSLLLAGFLAWFLPATASSQGLPNSIKLLYFPKKNFHAGDWVLYQIDSRDYEGQAATDYQRVQIGSELAFRGENCFWLETGWGQSRDKLASTTVLMSEAVFQDSLAEARIDVHMRRMHLNSLPDGTPLVSDARLANAFRPMGELKSLIPERKMVGLDTVVVKGQTFYCKLYEEVIEHGQIEDLPDSSVRYLIRTVRRRWIDPSVSITGLVREIERKEKLRHAWPLGKVSTDFPRQVVEFYDYEVQLVDFGKGAKPLISDRVKHISDPTLPRGASQP